MTARQFRISFPTLSFWLAAVVCLAAQTVSAQKLSAFTATSSEQVYGVGNWIWADKTTAKQTCRLWKTVAIPSDAVVVEARVRTTADNSYRFFFDGREISRGSAWETLTECDITALMKPGTHVLAMEGFNDYSTAGAIVALLVEFSDGQVMKVGSDHTWRVAPTNAVGWEKATRPGADWTYARVLGSYGMAPWSRESRIMKLAPLQPIVMKFWKTAWFQITTVSVSVVAVLLCLYLVNRLTVQSKAQELLRLERARIARDFHDDLGARITQLVLMGEVTQRELPAGGAPRAKMEQLCTRLRDLSGSLKEVVWAVNSQRDTLRDFVIYVCNYAEAFFAGSVIRCRFDVAVDLPEVSFDLPTRRNLLLAVKEALNNAAKHSEATEVLLRIGSDGKTVTVGVEDNGRGFEPQPGDSTHNGLTNMTQRMKSLGGDCRITSAAGQGCRIEFQMPLAPNRSRWFSSQRVETTGAPAAPSNAEVLPARSKVA